MTEAEDERLSQAFWQSVSLEEPFSATFADEDVTPTNAPGFMFGSRDGVLWSPGLPKRGSDSLSALQSPLSRKVTFGTMPNMSTFVPEAKVLMSPSPSDPFAAFPSFSAVLSLDQDVITYPAPAIVERG